MGFKEEFEKIASSPRLSPERERELFETWDAFSAFPEGSPEHRRAQEARHEVLRAHIPLCFTVAHRYRSPDISRDDIFQAANIGLAGAFDKYDRQASYRFSTHATGHIRNAIQAELLGVGLIRRPNSPEGRVFNMHYTKWRRQAIQDIQSETDEVAIRARVLEIARREHPDEGITAAFIDDMIRTRPSAGTSSEYAMNRASLNDPLRPAIPEAEQAALDKVEQSLQREWVNRALRGLSPKARVIVERRLEGKSTDEIGQEFGLRRAAVYKVELNAKTSMRRVLSAHLRESGPEDVPDVIMWKKFEL